MNILNELLQLVEQKAKKKKVTKSLRRRVYHADYLRTKDKPYRKYDPSERTDENTNVDFVSEGLDRGIFPSWVRKMREQGAVEFENAELDVIVAIDAEGEVIGSFDKAKKLDLGVQ